MQLLAARVSLVLALVIGSVAHAEERPARAGDAEAEPAARTSPVLRPERPPPPRSEGSSGLAGRLPLFDPPGSGKPPSRHELRRTQSSDPPAAKLPEPRYRESEPSDPLPSWDPKPDLQLGSIAMPSSGGTLLPAGIQIENTGQFPSPASHVRFACTAFKDGNAIGSCLAQTEVGVPPIPAGSSASPSVPPLPAGATTCDWQGIGLDHCVVTITVDVRNEVAEADEDDNDSSYTLYPENPLTGGGVRPAPAADLGGAKPRGRR